MTQPTFVVDSRGAKYQLGKCLGEGGQGAVYAVQGGRLAAKVLAAGSKTDPKRLERQLQFLRTLDLAGIPIAQPEAVLASPHAGYIMRLLTDMSSLKQLMVPPSGTTSLRRWYLDTGGLRRRLKVCGRAATALAMLHAKGLCYGDVSPANIFVSTVTTSDTVYLIDADNVRYESSPNNQPVYTPGYGAPEVVARRGFVSTLTDAHGLAVVAFATLVLVHPLQGDLVEEGDPDLEERALCGLLPWIDHPTDPANRSSRGIRERDVVLSGNLRHLASQAFGDGLSDPRKRPSASEWAEALERASRNCLVCPNCKATFYRTAESCPWCSTPRSPFLYGRLRIWDPALNDKTGGYVIGPDKHDQVVDSFALAAGDQMLIDQRIAAGHSHGHAASELLTVSFTGKGVDIQRRAPEAVLELRKPPRRHALTDAPVTLKADGDLPQTTIHLGPSDQLHRVLDLWLMGGKKS